MRKHGFLVPLVGLALTLQTLAVGPKVSLDFDQAEVGVVLRRIGELWGRALEVDRQLKGKVTIHVRNMDAEEAVRLVLARLPESTRFSVKSMRVSLVVRQEILLEATPAAKVISFLHGQYPDVEFLPHPQMNGFYAVGTRAEILSIKNDVPNLDMCRDVPPPPGGELLKNLPVLGSLFRETTGEPNTESYKAINENVLLSVSQQPLSTFGADVDTGSYSNVRRLLNSQQKPPADAVRIEEMLNYFSYDYALPQGSDPVGITTRVARCPWKEGHSLLQVGLRTAPWAASEKLPPRNLVFLVDVSGSMAEPDKRPLVQQSLNCLVQELNGADRIALVVYAGSAGVVLEPTTGDKKDAIREAIQRLEAGGSTNGAQGILRAYQMARENFQKDAVNRVILCTDGDFNVGVTSEGELVRLIEQERQSGVFLSVLGFGRGNLKDDKMEQLADKGNGNYAYIDSLAEARKVLVSQAGATLVTVAKDVKIQVEFNPARVAGYRLLGYENRALQNQDFNDDAKDAGEMGQGHSVTVLYELIPAGEEMPKSSLRYQGERVPVLSDEYACVKVRYKPVDSQVSRLLEHVVESPEQLEEPQGDLAFASAVAAFGMVLRDSPWKGSCTLPGIQRWASGSLGVDADGYRAEFVELVKRAAKVL